jgi:uncharacterized membrane protein YkoI
MTMFHRYFLLVVILIACFIPQTVTGRDGDSLYYYQTSSQLDSISQQAAVTIAQQHINGRVLAINLAKNAYRVKILSNQGTVHVVVVNAFDGTILSSH